MRERGPLSRISAKGGLLCIYPVMGKGPLILLSGVIHPGPRLDSFGAPDSLIQRPFLTHQEALSR